MQPGTNNTRSGDLLDSRCHRNKHPAPVHRYANQLAAKLQVSAPGERRRWARQLPPTGL